METKKTIIRKPIKRTKPLSGAQNEVLTEANRYLENAKDILREKGKLNYDAGIYTDKKYVRAAGHYAYHGILYALNAAKLVTVVKSTQRLDVKDYQQALGKENRKMLDYFNYCYDIFHLNMGYDGSCSKTGLTENLKIAHEIIMWATKKIK